MPARAAVADLLVTTAAEPDATKRLLASRASVKAAMKIVDTSSDDLIDSLIARVSGLIVAECAMAQSASGGDPSFALDTLAATFNAGGYRSSALRLPWRVPVTEVVSVTEDGASLTVGTDFRLEAVKPGRLVRLSSGAPTCWSSAEIVVTFKAGFAGLPATSPAALETACIEQVKAMFLGAQRDPALRSLAVNEVGVESYSVPGGDTFRGVLLPQVIDAVASYVNPLP